MSGRWPLERLLFALAGTMTLLSVLLAVLVSPWFLLLTVFVGLNQWLFVGVGGCPASLVLDVKHFDPERRRELVAAIEASTGSLPPKDLMMSPDQVRQLRKMGMQVGAHTVSHPILTRLSAGAALEEIANSKQHLQDILKERVDLFAYPNGMPRRDYGAEHVKMVRLVQESEEIAAVAAQVHNAAEIAARPVIVCARLLAVARDAGGIVERRQL